MDLPEKLMGNRTCALYLVEVLKTIVDDCIYKSASEIACRNVANDGSIDIDNSLFITMMQQMVGGGIQSEKN